MLRLLAATVLLLLWATPARSDSLADELRTIVDAAHVDGLRWPDFASERALVAPLYESAAYAPRWLDHDRPTPPARDALAVLRDAGMHALDPLDYDAQLLADAAERLAADRHASASDLARFDVGLSVAVVRLLGDLHVGRIDPHTLQFDYDVGPKRAELPAIVDEAVVQGRPRDAVSDAAPRLAEHRRLEEQLGRYRQLAADPTLAPVAVAPIVRPGDPLRSATRLARWLAALGDLAPDAPAPKRYAGPLVEAVKRFQARHGLAPDGIIGAPTAVALAVPAATRARQIELALERLRWLPTLEPGRAVVVNVPAFEVAAFEDLVGGAPPALRMSVVVGRAFRNETPFFAGALQTLVFAPYWHVPVSIARKEILPKLHQDPGYLAAQEMDVVREGIVLPPSPAALALVRAGTAELRQRPGPLNALGRVKFLFPNDHHVYMHDTPARGLFRKARRDFSHGCIRLGDAPALVRWVLAGEGWDDARVDAMLAVERASSVTLRHSMPIVIEYATAVARSDGTIAFYEDLYGHDAALAHALGAGWRYR